MNVDDARQRVLGVGAALDRNAQYRFGFLDGNVEVPSIIRYDVRIVLVTARLAHRSRRRTDAATESATAAATADAILFGRRQSLHGL